MTEQTITKHQGPYHLLVDVGNTFVKWGRYAPPSVPGANALGRDHLLEYDRVLLDEIQSLTSYWKDLPAPSKIVVSNVAGTRLRNPLLRAFESWVDVVQPQWIVSQQEQCGVTNGYLNPGQLGSDRWAAMIGARAIMQGKPLLVAVCGTATTVDLLSASGRFVGGAIMPGLGLMQRVLHEQTAALPDSQGEYVDYPRQTVDAIASGCAHAQAGAVERLYFLHKHTEPSLHCVISGGAARTLAPRLTIDFTYYENLVLDGLYQIAQTDIAP
jgi:type III pantothenate kinase